MFENSFQTDVYIEIMEVIDIDEADKSITLYLYTLLYWNNELYDVMGTINDTIKWMIIPTDFYDLIRRPRLLFENAYQIETFPAVGDDGFSYFWFYKFLESFEYAEYLKITLGCDMDFTKFPFDKHECEFNFFTPEFNYPISNFSSIIVYDTRSSNLVSQNQSIELLAKRTSFKAFLVNEQKFTFKAIVGYNYSLAGIKLTFQRSDISLLISGYFIPSGLFALFSIISLFTSLDNVSKQNKNLDYDYLQDILKFN